MTTENYQVGFEGALYYGGTAVTNWIGDVEDFTPPQRSVGTSQFATQQRGGRIMRGRQFKTQIDPGSGTIMLVRDEENIVQAEMFADHANNVTKRLYQVFEGDSGDSVTYSWDVQLTGWNVQTPMGDKVTIEVPFIDIGSSAPLIVPRLPTQTVSIAGSAVTLDLKPYVSSLSDATYEAVDADNNVTVAEANGVLSINHEATATAGDTDTITVTITDADGGVATTEIPVDIVA